MHPPEFVDTLMLLLYHSHDAHICSVKKCLDIHRMDVILLRQSCQVMPPLLKLSVVCVRIRANQMILPSASAVLVFSTNKHILASSSS